MDFKLLDALFPYTCSSAGSWKNADLNINIITYQTNFINNKVKIKFNCHDDNESTIKIALTTREESKFDWKVNCKANIKPVK